MDSSTRDRLHALVLKARPLLIGEARDLLEGVYGLGKDGRFAPAASLPAVQMLPEVGITRVRLETFLADETAAGLTASGAVEKLVKEVAFTHLNRLVAFKMLEGRKLVKGTIDKYHNSNAFAFYRADHPDEEARYQAGSLPQNLLGEGPRDIAYRHFLLSQYAEMAAQIRVLFDPDNLVSRLFPRPYVLETLIGLLNDPNLVGTWKDDETIGWVYQYFNADELERAFREARLSNKKFSAADIPAVTQLFTPRWIVKYLVQNTLGQLWMGMHPDSRLRDDLDYLVPLTDQTTVLPRLARDITLLDPACGTMHFGLVAFDLFAMMYREEIEHVGEPGWPDQSSVDDPSHIPAAIIEHNLFGIDIDLRAVQLSALTLLLKARSLNPKASISDHNLACADVLLLDGHRLTAFLEEMHSTHPIYERLIRGLWTRLQDANQLGSLLRLETDLAELVAAERHKAENPMLPGFSPDQFETEAGQQEFWTIIEGQIIQAFDEFTRRRAEEGRDERYFTGEAIKGLRMLDIMLRRYDVVVTNPPYMSSSNMNNHLKRLVTRAYPAGKSDLYAAFIQRCLSFATENGRIGMLTMHSFMFISSYRVLREDIRRQAAVETEMHLGSALFDVGNPGTLQTSAFVLRREPYVSSRDNVIGIYFRLVKERNAEAKRLRFEQSLARLLVRQDDSILYRYRQGDFDAVNDAPWVYWITSEMRHLFMDLPKLNEIAHPVHGTTTYDNTRFLRFWWEVGSSQICLKAENWPGFLASNRNYAPYMKGGSFRRWYGNQEYVLQLTQDGEVFINWLNANRDRIRGQEYIFQRGITYSHLSSGPISFRLMPPGFIFDQSGSCIFFDDPTSLLGILNSTLVLFAKRLINPTVNFQVGSLGVLPIPTGSSSSLKKLVEQVIALARAVAEESEVTYDFVAPTTWPTGVQDSTTRVNQMAAIEQQINEEVYRLYGISDNERSAIEDELRESLPIGEDDEVEASTTDAGDTEASVEDEAATGGQLSMQKLAERWVSYAIGIVLGRFQPGVEGALGYGCSNPAVAKELRTLAIPDAIVVVDDERLDDLVPRIERTLELMQGSEEAERVIATATGGKPLADYLRGDFYKAHVQQYRKRPVYWLLQSLKRGYSVYVFHERMTEDTLHLLRGTEYLGGAINAAHNQQADLHAALLAAVPGPAKKKVEKQLDAVSALLTDLEAFDANLAAVTGATDTRGEVVGWRPEVDDGVLLNLAPLHTLMPSWAAEPRKAWEALARGDYDWARTARRYWPDRVEEACRHNKSFAIAHGLPTD